jgi:CBS-domain-containing membrane protein
MSATVANLGSNHLPALDHALRRLEEMIDQETEALEAHRPIDLDDIVRRKSRSLLELTRIARAMSPEGTGSRQRADLARIREKLVQNHDVLKIHLSAVHEISGAIAGVLRDAESDGTYSSQGVPGRLR